MSNGQRVRALREWAHRHDDDKPRERQERLSRLVAAEVALEKDLDALTAAREAAGPAREWAESYGSHSRAFPLEPLRRLLDALDGKAGK